MNVYGLEVRGTHHACFRAGEWALLTGCVWVEPDRHPPDCIVRQAGACMVVLFEDGRTDVWPLDDDAAGYEFRPQRSEREELAKAHPAGHVTGARP